SQGSVFNTDDRPRVEFGFARSLGRKLFDVDDLHQTVRARHEDRPAIHGEVDWERVEDERIAMLTGEGLRPIDKPFYTPGRRRRAGAQAHYLNHDLPAALTVWRRQPGEPRGAVEIMVVAEAL